MKPMKKWASLEALLAAIADAALPSFDPPLTVASRTSEDYAPLHVAAIWGDAEAVEMLVRAGADVNAVGDKGYTPLLWAVREGDLATARVLRAAGASPHVRCEFGHTAAEAAVLSGNQELIAICT